MLGEASQPFVIDWPNASCGDPAAEVCRSYLILKLHADEVAEPYVDAYCRVTAVPRRAYRLVAVRRSGQAGRRRSRRATPLTGTPSIALNRLIDAHGSVRLLPRLPILIVISCDDRRETRVMGSVQGQGRTLWAK